MTVRVDTPPDVIVVGLKTAVTPGGKFPTPNVTFCGEPPVVAVETLKVTDPDWLTDCELGATCIEKSFAGAVPVVKFDIMDQSPY